MFDLAAKHPDAIHLCMGEPDFATPSFIIEAAFQAAKEGKTHYTPNAGFLSLRRAVAEKYKKEQGAYYDPEGEVLITVGAMEALVLTLMSILNSGDEVIIPDPYWPNYQAQVLLAEGKPVFVPLYEEGGWILTADRVLSHLTPRCRAIIINSPHNPTGSVYGSNELQEIGRVCKENDILIISDEAYEKIIYDGEYHSICSLPDHRGEYFPDKENYLMYGQKYSNLKKLVLYAIVFTYLVFVLFPLIWLVQSSFKSMYQALKIPPALIWRPTFEAYQKALGGGMLKAFLNSAIVSLSNVVLVLVLGVSAGYALANLKTKASQNIGFWILTVRMAPAFGIIVPLYIILRSFRLVDTIFAVMVAHLTINLPLAIWLLKSYFEE
ncbi:unnamed protein product, partial [marine sediment metagenome]